MNRRLTWIFIFLIKCLAICFFAQFLQQTNDPFPWFGTDASVLVKPDFAVQASCVFLIAVALFIPVQKFLMTRTVVVIVAALLASHRFAIDDSENKMLDVYLGVPVQAVPIPQSDDNDFSVQASVFGFAIKVLPDGKSLWCFSPSMIGLDRSEISQLNGL